MGRPSCDSRGRLTLMNSACEVYFTLTETVPFARVSRLRCEFDDSVTLYGFRISWPASYDSQRFPHSTVRVARELVSTLESVTEITTERQLADNWTGDDICVTSADPSNLLMFSLCVFIHRYSIPGRPHGTTQEVGVESKVKPKKHQDRRGVVVR